MKSPRGENVRIWRRIAPWIVAGQLFAGVAWSHFGPVPISLKAAPVPTVPGLTDGANPIVLDRDKAIALGKALFWDVNVGSDGMACASCHFHAGTDRRTKNQLSPSGKDPVVPDEGFEQSASGEFVRPNYTAVLDDFPFHQTSEPLSPVGDVLYSLNDVAGSSGTFNGEFEEVGGPETQSDECARSADAVFHVNSVGTRLVTARNAPSVINSVFNHRNFWDGSANNVFNGSSAWGDRDPDAGVWVRTGPDTVEKQRLDLPNSSLASQAIGPALNTTEMSCTQRTFADLGRKLGCRRPLEHQKVRWDDSVLGELSRSSPGALKTGLEKSYFTMITETFAPRYWSYEEVGEFGAPPGADPSVAYTQYEANFGMFFALAIQLYESTLISDDSPFDRSAVDSEGIPVDLSESAKSGFTEFRIAHCNLCHIGPTLSAAAVVTNSMMVESDPQAFGNQTFEISTTDNVVTRFSVSGGPSFIDTGFASTGVTPSEWDPGLGGNDPFGNPLSFADQYLQLIAGNPAAVVDPYVDEVRPCDLDLPVAVDQRDAHPSFFTRSDGIVAQSQNTRKCFQDRDSAAFLPTPEVAAAELNSPQNSKMLSAALGSFKIPSLRNVELTGPYMHNGGMATLDEVVEFYTRGGNYELDAKHFGTVFAQVDLRFSQTKRDDIVAFLKTLTDDRVRYERAPFDHPEIWIPNGHVGDHETADTGNPLASDLAEDEYLVVAAVGAGGRATPLQPFEEYLDPCVGEACNETIATGGPPPPDDPNDPLVCEVPEPAAGVASMLAVLAGLGVAAGARRRPSRRTQRSP